MFPFLHKKIKPHEGKNLFLLTSFLFPAKNMNVMAGSEWPFCVSEDTNWQSKDVRTEDRETFAFNGVMEHYHISLLRHRVQHVTGTPMRRNF